MVEISSHGRSDGRRVKGETLINGHGGSGGSRVIRLFAVMAVLSAAFLVGYVLYESSSDSLVVVLNPENETIQSDSYTGIPVTPTEYPGNTPYEEVPGNSLKITLKDPVRDTSANTSRFNVDLRVVYPGQSASEATVYNIDLTLKGDVSSTVHEIADVTFMIPKVFWGWKEVTDPSGVSPQTVKQSLLPGDVLSTSLGEKTYWIKPEFLPSNYDVVTSFPVSCGKTTGNTVEIHPITDYKEYNNTSPSDFKSQKSTGFTVNDPNRVSRIVFGDGARLLGTIDLGGKAVLSSKTMPDGSLAKVYLYDGGKVTPYTGVKLKNDVRFEHISLTGFADLELSKDHGDGASAGIFACGHSLVMGMGVETAAKDLIHVPQIFGGDVDSTDRGLFGSNFVMSKLKADTHIVINSGIYANVVGGSRGGEIDGSTTVVVNGGVVMDTLVGGSSTFREPKLNLPIIGDLYEPVVNPGKISGGTNVYINGGLFPGDYYEYSKYGDLGHRDIELLKVLTESCIITGGSNDGSIGLDTNVIISGDADVWDVQGGGRRGSSTLNGTSNVTICGNAVVRHTVSGSITEGIDTRGDSLSAVHHTNVTICENARVYAVFGAGYDTFTQSNVPSVRSADSTIKVNMSGGVVGYIYGGGYRGTVGTSESSMIESVEINITGGTVLHDVYGGGRGGLDRIFHDANGNLVAGGHGTGYTDSTGSSKMYAKNITVNISGGTVRGNVYGGGQSIPFKNIENSVMVAEVAAVYCENMTINVVGGSSEVLGGIFGVGNGIDQGGIGGIPEIRFYKNDSEPEAAIPWKSGITAYSGAEATQSYDRYAYVKAGTVTVNVSGYRDPASSGGTGGGIYGGGNYASAETGRLDIAVSDSVLYGPVMGGGVLGTVTAGAPGVGISVSRSTVNGTVFGGGFGSVSAGAGGSGSLTVNGPLAISVSGGTLAPGTGVPALVGGGNYGNVSASSLSVDIRDARVDGNVMGGGIMGTVSVGSSSVGIAGATVNGTVFGGGLGTDSIDQKDKGVVTVTGDTTITVEDSVLSPSEIYAVVGGGCFANMSFGNLQVNMFGNGAGRCVINGDVHAGGIGYTYTAADPSGAERTMYSASAFGNREIVLAGATVNGNVYGGSRLGSDFDGTEGSPMKDVHIRLLSGKVTQSIFGGGFQGDSYLDSYIYLGAAAVSDAVGKPCGSLSVGSVYGGSNQKGSTQPEDLFKGKPVIDISGHRKIGDRVDSCDITVNGVIYGCGNFSNVAVGADISIEGMSNDRGHPISSIQSADLLTVDGSELFIRGGSAGNVLESTAPMAIGMVEMVVLKGSVVLHLMSDTYGIGGYRSMNGEAIAIQEDTLESYRNEIRMYNGKMFSVLGDMDRGLDSSGNGTVVEGYTLLSVETDETYFGAYAMSSDLTINGGFTTNRGRDLANILVNEGTPGTNTWYISGHSEKSNLLTLKDGTFSGKFGLLQIGGSDTFFNYDGCSAESVSSDSMVATAGPAQDSLATQIGMVLGVPLPSVPPAEGTAADDISFNTPTGTLEVVTHSFVNGDWVPVKSAGDITVRSLSGSSLNVDVRIIGNTAKNVGNLGDFIVTFTEMSRRTVVQAGSDGTVTTIVKEVPLNVVDYRFGIYVDPGKDRVVDLSTTVSGIYRKDDGLFHAVSHVVLPSLDQRYRYGIEVEGMPAVTSMTVLADNGYDGIEGWIASRYTSEPVTVGPSGTDVPDFGVAGIKMATLTVDLAFTREQTAQPQRMTVTADLENKAPGDTTVPYTYNIEITFQAMDDVSMFFLYQSYCGEGGGFTEVSGKFRYISFQGDGTADSPYVMNWAPCILRDEGGVYTVLPAEGQLSPFTCQYGAVPLKEKYYFSSGPGTPSSQATLESAVKQMMGRIDSLQCETGDFDYGKNYIGLFDDRNAVKKHSPSAAVKEDSAVFAGFGIKVTFAAEGIPLKITNVVLRPGQSLADKGLANLEDEIADTGSPGMYNHICSGYDRLGYEMARLDPGTGVAVRTWVIDGPSRTPFDFSAPCTESVSLTVPWESEVYTLRITFEGTDRLTESMYIRETYPGNSQPDIAVEGNVMTASVSYGSTYRVLLGGSGYIAQSITHAADADIHTDIRDPSNPAVKIIKTGTNWVPQGSFIDVGISLVESGYVTITLRGAEVPRFSDSLLAGETVEVNGNPLSAGGMLSLEYGSLTQNADGAEFTVVSSEKSSYYALWDGKTPLTDRTKCGTPVVIDVHAHKDMVLSVYHDVSVSVTKEQGKKTQQIKYDTNERTKYRFTVTSVDLNGQYREEKSEPALVFTGYKVNVFKDPAADIYTFPTAVDGVGSTQVGTSSAVYTIDGTAVDVRIKLFRSGAVTVFVDFPADGGALLESYFANYPDYVLKVAVTDPERTSETPFGAGDIVLDANGTAELTVKVSNKHKTECTLDCRMPGFSVTPDPGNGPGLTEYRFALEAATYRIFFPDQTAVLPKEDYSYTSPAVDWSIRDNLSAEVPVMGQPGDWPDSCIMDGHPVWKTYVDGTAGLYHGIPDPSMFDAAGDAYLIPFEKAREAPDKPVGDGVVYLTMSAFEWGPASDRVDLNYPGELYLRGADGTYATYDGDLLTIYCDNVGTGSMVLVDDLRGFVLEVVILQDISTIDGGPSFIVFTLDKSGTESVPDVQGSEGTETQTS